KYQNSLKDIENQLPELQQLSTKVFSQEDELQKMKSDLSSLEREIALKIQENQLKEANPQDDKLSNETKLTDTVPVIQLPVKNGEEAKVCTTAESNTDKWQERSFSEMRRSNRMKF
ncbi:hypothetical protein D0809_27965, partial [Flavobacterium circumlabens]